MQLSPCNDVLKLPKALPDSDPSWFGFMITVPHGTRDKIVGYLEKHNIQTRMLFAGNLTKHPCFDDMRKAESGYRIVDDLDNTDKIMEDSFWIGVYPGMTTDKIDYMAQCIKEAVNGCKG